MLVLFSLDLLTFLQQPRSFSAAKLFDGMPRRLNDGVNMETAVAGGEDRIGALPDELLQYLMSFLPSRDSVQTCVLAKRWRTLWKSVPALRVNGPRSYNGEPSNTFVDELLRLRDPTLVSVCDISCPDDVEMDDNFKCYYPFEDQLYFSWHYEAFRYMEPWLRYALLRQVQVLRISFPWLVTNLTLISSHLKRLELYRIRFQECPLDFSSCKVLEVFEMVNCEMCIDIISSQSLQHLDIHGGNFVINSGDSHVRISTPNLVGLRLEPSWGLTPLLDSMPSLVTAAVTLQEVCREVCYCDNPSCEGCDARPGFSDYPLVLEGLSCATNLKLTIADSTRLSVFRKDLKWRPMFSKLKTLFLNQWCVGDDFTGLVYFLQHSPILEMLTLQLDLQTSEEYHLRETGESCNSSEHLLLAQHLKVVKIIRGTQEDVIVHRILKILCAHGVPSEKIEIE